MDIKTCTAFRQSLLNIINESMMLKDLIDEEIKKYKPNENKEENNNNDFDLTKKVNKKVSKPRAVNKKIEELKENNKPKKINSKTIKDKSIKINNDNLTLEM